MKGTKLVMNGEQQSFFKLRIKFQSGAREVAQLELLAGLLDGYRKVFDVAGEINVEFAADGLIVLCNGRIAPQVRD